MINDVELSVEHRWISLTQKRGDQTCIPSKYQIDSIMLMDQNSLNLFLNVSRKFVPIGSKYLAPALDDDTVEQKTHEKNKWGTKFRDVDRVMAWLCFDAKVNKDEGEMKDYRVVYEDRFHGVVETEVWRFHEEMDIPSHRVRILKLNDKVIWDRKKKFSLV